jgi:coproporphyrinogen III oxidase-like Fe-S oxidoreductase
VPLSRLGREIEEAITPPRLAKLIEGGFIELDGRGLRATSAGRQRLNAVLAALVG